MTKFVTFLLLALAGLPAACQTWTRIAVEGDAFTASGVVRYGSGSAWIEKQVSGAGQCTNAFFGSDPLNGVVKECQVPVQAPPPPAPAASAPPVAKKECIHKSYWTPFGSGTEWVRGTRDGGAVKVSWWGYWCPEVDGTWGAVMMQCVEGRTCVSAAVLSAELDTAARSSDPVASFQAARARLASPVLEAEKATWSAARADLIAALERIKPAVALWVVAPNPSSTTTPPTRPMFLLADPSKQVTQRATVGARCDCSKPVLKNTLTLCPLAGTVDPLTACVRGTP